MSARKAKPIPGVRLKFRTDDGWLIATAWIDDKPAREIGRCALDHVGPSGGEMHDAFVNCMSRMFNAKIEEVSGVSGIVGKRAKPRYKGEI